MSRERDNGTYKLELGKQDDMELKNDTAADSSVTVTVDAGTGSGTFSV